MMHPFLPSMRLGDENIRYNACSRMTVALREQISILEKHVVYSRNFSDVVLVVEGISNNWSHRDFKPYFMEEDHDVGLIGYLISVNPSQHNMILKRWEPLRARSLPTQSEVAPLLGCVMSAFEAAMNIALSFKPVAKSNTIDHYPLKKRCRSKMESKRVKYEPGCHEALSPPNNSSCVVSLIEVQGYSAHVTTMGNIVFPLLALEVRMGHGLPLLGSSNDLTIGIDDLLNQLEQFEPSVPFFYEGSSLEGRGGTGHTVIIDFLDKFITAGKNKGEGLLPSSSVDVTTRKGLVDMFVQGVNLRSRWRESDLHTTQAVLEVKQHDLDYLRSQKKDTSDKYAQIMSNYNATLKELNHMTWVRSKLNDDV
nr:hypothetical protein [Tanacetum cinerariifolium]